MNWSALAVSKRERSYRGRTLYYVIAQIIGFLGAAILILSYQCKDSKRLFAMQMSANAVYIIHFFMLGAFSGCVNLLISFFRNLCCFAPI